MSKDVVLDVVTPCGLRVSVHALPNGAGNEKMHIGEYVWCVESSRIFGRGYDPDPMRAKILAISCAQQVLQRGQATLSEQLMALTGGGL